MSNENKLINGMETNVLPLGLVGPHGLLTDQINWEDLSQIDISEKIAYYILTTCDDWDDLEESSFSSILNEKHSSIEGTLIKSSWEAFEIFQKARIDGKYFYSNKKYYKNLILTFY